MTDATLKNLKKAAKGISSSQTTDEKLKSLSQAFETFTKETARLETAYAALHSQFQEVNIELETTNSKLNHKIFEFHIMMNYMTSLLNNMSQGILFVGLDGVITTYNRVSEKLLGIECHQALFNKFWEVFPDTLFGFSMQKALESNTAPNISILTLALNENMTIDLEVNVSFILESPHLGEGIEIPPLDFNKGMIILLRDITEIRRLQVVAQRNDRMAELGEMAAMVAHEIRNPLGGIKGFASLLKRDLKDQPDLEQMAQYIVDGTNNLNRLVTDVLNYSRPIQMKFELTDLSKIVEEIRDHVLMDATLNKNIEIHIQSRVSKLVVFIDAQLIKSTILNIIINAIQAMPDGGSITITLIKKEDFAIVQISDTGIGIPRENLEKIFSPFFTTKPNGHGFGLSEVYRIVQAHQGTIDVRSDTGKGATFTIKLPLKL